jgi:quinol monooxygenase YgiN
MIVLIAQHFAQEGKDDEVAVLLSEMSDYCNSDAEPGCLLYIVNRSTENPRHFLIYEQYADQRRAYRPRRNAEIQGNPPRQGNPAARAPGAVLLGGGWVADS